MDEKYSEKYTKQFIDHLLPPEDCYESDILLSKNKDLKIEENALAGIYDDDEYDKKHLLPEVYVLPDELYLKNHTDIRYTYADYCTWDDDVRFELIDGIAYMMAGPQRIHQKISSELHGQLWSFLKGKPCEVYCAPFVVRLNTGISAKEHFLNNQDDVHFDTVVQPDIIVVCDESKLEDKSCAGVPDLIIEITSPSNSGRDKLIKLKRYLKAAVREYWIVEPESKTILIHILRDGQYIISTYNFTDIIPVHVLPDCKIDLRTI